MLSAAMHLPMITTKTIRVRFMWGCSQNRGNYNGEQVARDQWTIKFNASGGCELQEASSWGMDLYQNPAHDSRNQEQCDSN